jgi:3-phenylpropionate/trans-cinnamate dioxygenase ferredoxin subunit
VTAVRVCGTGDVARGAARRFDVDGRRLCVVRLPRPAATTDTTAGGPDAWYVIGDTCSHADYSLAEGELWPEELEIECPQHGSTFSLETGEPQTLPATQPVPTYAVTVVDGDVLVELVPTEATA